MSSRIIGIILALMCLAAAGYGQVTPDSSHTDENILDQTIEDAMIDIESDDQTDWTQYTDVLQDLQKRPINLNRASREDLLLLPGMNDILVNSLFEYIRQFGPLTSVYELQAVEGFDYTVFQKISPFIQVKESGAKDISPGTMHPAGPSFQEILTESKHELILRTITILEEQKGYTPPDTNSDGSLTTRYLGNPYRYYARYRMRFNQNFSAALVAEKDQGEQMMWDPSTNTYGFDFLAGHVFLKDFGHLKRLVVGDYNVQAGQGLILSTGLGFGKGSETINAVKRQDIGIRPFSSVNENQFLRGAAATVAFGNIYTTAFFSRTSKDANISSLDSLTDDVQLVSTLQTSGLHRTEAELMDKDAIQETIYGGRLQYQRRWFNVGATHFFQNFGAPIQPSVKDYNKFDFSGDQNYLSAVDFDITRRNFNIFGELARSMSGGTAGVLGIMGSLNPKADIAIQYRNFSPDFHSFRGYAFAEKPTAIQNERGVYMGLKIYPGTKWTFATFFDYFEFPWNGYQVSYPSKGYEYMAQLEYKPSRSMQIYVRWRSDHKERNASELPDGQQLEMLVPTQRDALRLNFSYKLSKDVTIKSRIEKSWYTKGYNGNEEIDANGFLFYQDLIWKLGWKWKFTARYAIFDAQDYNARIYAYENDILGFFNIPAYSGKGTRYYAILNFKPVKGLEFWLRFARSNFYNDKTIGSSLTEIQGNTRSEVKVQMRLSF